MQTKPQDMHMQYLIEKKCTRHVHFICTWVCVRVRVRASKCICKRICTCTCRCICICRCALHLCMTMCKFKLHLNFRLTRCPSQSKWGCVQTTTQASLTVFKGVGWSERTVGLGHFGRMLILSPKIGVSCTSRLCVCVSSLHSGKNVGRLVSGAWILVRQGEDPECKLCIQGFGICSSKKTQSALHAHPCAELQRFSKSHNPPFTKCFQFQAFNQLRTGF